MVLNIETIAFDGDEATYPYPKAKLIDMFVFQYGITHSQKQKLSQIKCPF
ncbi:hypothetical protein [Helicobacter acinonychis]|nr:hypothetical protein [Helicobacter acinonychis]STP04418.1 Uncharacterised protein [Helicobacter acinonychis]